MQSRVNLFGGCFEGTIRYQTKRVLKVILNLKDKLLYGPNARERLEILPEGYIDGSEIQLSEEPVKDHELFLFRGNVNLWLRHKQFVTTSYE